MRIGSLERAICAAMISMITAQGVRPAEETVSKDAETEAVFAYRSFTNRGLAGYLFPNGPWSLPNYVPVELLPVDPAAWANATIGSAVTFRVVRGASAADVFDGALIDAKVTQIRTGKLRVRRGRLEPRVLEVAVEGAGVKFTLESTARSHFDRTVKHVATAPLRGIGVAIEIPEYLYVGIVCSTGGCDI